MGVPHPPRYRMCAVATAPTPSCFTPLHLAALVAQAHVVAATTSCESESQTLLSQDANLYRQSTTPCLMAAAQLTNQFSLITCPECSCSCSLYIAGPRFYQMIGLFHCMLMFYNKLFGNVKICRQVLFSKLFIVPLPSAQSVPATGTARSLMSTADCKRMLLPYVKSSQAGAHTHSKAVSQHQ